MKELPFVFLAVSGDLAEDGTKWSDMKEHFFDPARDLLRRTAVWTVRGNHEKDGILYRSLFALPNNKTYYSFDAGNVHYVVLDVYDPNRARLRKGEPMREMLAWLDKDLATTKADWVIVSQHEPIFNVGGHGSSCGREDILPVIEKHEVDLVICGHSHLYERFRPIGPAGRKPVIHITSGGGGGPTYDTGPSPLLATSYAGLHYCVFTVHGKRLELVAKTPDGKVIDKFELEKSDGRYPKEIMDAAVTTDQAGPMVKVFKLSRVSFDSLPAPGKECVAVIEAGTFPNGWSVDIRAGTDCRWQVKPLTFTAGDGPTRLTVTPPEGLKVAATPWMGYFDPPLDVHISLKRGAIHHERDSVPTLVASDVLRRLVPAPAPIDLPAAGAAITVDGDLSDWSSVAPLRLPSTGAASKHLRLAWTADGLLGALTARDAEIAVNAAKPWTADALEINLEMDAARRLAIQRRTPVGKLLLFPAAQKGPAPAGVMVQSGPYKRRLVRAVSKRTSTGYEIEFLIAAEALAPAEMRAGAKLGFHFVLRNGGEVAEQFADMSKVHTTWGSPVFWGALRLTGK